MLPYVILHMGVSADGRIDYGLPDGAGPYYALVNKFHADLDLSGSNTILSAPLSEDPQSEIPELYAMYANKPDRPALAVVDSRGQVHNWPAILKQPFWCDFIALCARSTPQPHLEELQTLGVKTIVAGDERVDLRAALEALRERFGIKVVRVDSGGILNGVLLRAGLVDEVNLVVGPCLVGGTSPRTMFSAPDLSSPDGVIPLKLEHVETLNGDYVWLRYQVKN